MAWRTPKDYFNKLHEKLPVYPLTNSDTFTHPSLSAITTNMVYDGGDKILIPYYWQTGNGDTEKIRLLPNFWFGDNWHVKDNIMEDDSYNDSYNENLMVIDFDRTFECKQNYPYRSDEFVTSHVYQKYSKLLDDPIPYPEYSNLVPTSEFGLAGKNYRIPNVSKDTLFTQDLHKVMINGRYIKNVYNKSNFVGNITSFNGTEYTVDEFFEKFGDYLVIVREKDGEFCYSVNFNYGKNEEYGINSLAIPSIIVPITINNEIGLGDYSQYLNRDSQTIDGDYSFYIPYSVSSNKYQYNFLKNYSYVNCHTDFGVRACNVGPIGITPSKYKDYGVTLTNNIIEDYYEYQNREGGNYIYKNYSDYSLIGDKLHTGYVKDFGSYNLETTWEQKIHNCDLYYEKDYEIYDRVFTFNYKTGKDDALKIFQKQYTPMSICVFNQRDIEEYLRAFNVPYIYRYPDVLPLDWPEDFVVRKVRRDALANKSLNLNVEKVRREALANKEKVLSVNKVRRK